MLVTLRGRSRTRKELPHAGFVAGSATHVACAWGAVVPDGNGVEKDVLVTQLYFCLATQVALHLVLAQLVSEVVCVYLALLCWIGCAPEEVASGHEVKAVTGSCQALPVHGRGRGANGKRKTRRCFIMVLVALVAAVTSYGLSEVHKFHREHARVQFNKNYEDLNASGAQEWSVLFRAGRWSYGYSVNASSRRQALPARICQSAVCVSTSGCSGLKVRARQVMPAIP